MRIYVPWPMYILHTWWECSCAGDERETRGPIWYAYMYICAYVVGVLRWGRERDLTIGECIGECIGEDDMHVCIYAMVHTYTRTRHRRVHS